MALDLTGDMNETKEISSRREKVRAGKQIYASLPGYGNLVPA
jgi:hypothetical protein